MCDVWSDPYVIREMHGMCVVPALCCSVLQLQCVAVAGCCSCSVLQLQCVAWDVSDGSPGTMTMGRVATVWADRYITLGHVSFRCITSIIHMCDMTHSCVWHDSCTCVPWLVRMCDMTHSHVWHISFRCIAWLIHICGMIDLNVWQNSFICVTELIHMRDMTMGSFTTVWADWCITVWHDSFRCVRWRTHVWQNTFMCVTWLIDMGHDSLKCDMTPSHTPIPAFVMGTVPLHRVRSTGLRQIQGLAQLPHSEFLIQSSSFRVPHSEGFVNRQLWLSHGLLKMIGLFCRV